MESSAELPAQRQARIRREKREKKILQGGSARLEKITSLSGRPAESASEALSYVPSQEPDPGEVDLSSHSFALRSGQSPTVSETDIRQLLRSSSPFSSSGAQTNGFDLFSASGQAPIAHGTASQDPMIQMLQQMMGGMSPPGSAVPGGEGGDGSGSPPGLASMFGEGGAMESPQPPSTAAYIWKILHAIFSLFLGIYSLYKHPFNGARADRSPLGSPTDPRPGLFWVFATAELGLQGARYLLQGAENEGGFVGTISGFLPQPWKGRVKLAGRYSSIWTTMVGDAMVIIWILGLGAWWRGGTIQIQ